MNPSFYISRTLRHDDDYLSEDELLLRSSVIVVLAEPGAGKSQLLKRLADRLGVQSTSAKIFKSSPLPYSEDCLVLDGLDEVASIHSSGLDDLIVKASFSGAKQVIMASRSSEWEEARTHLVVECFHQDPLLVYLAPFSEEEQKELFDYRHSTHNFSAFQQQVESFNLEALLGNPLFLELFSDAFVEGNGSFIDKKTVFENAVKRLAYEASTSRVHKGAPSLSDRIQLSNEVFAVLLLSGAEGVTTADTLNEQYFPKLSDLIPSQSGVHSILDTRLFSPTEDPNNHIPVHRVVAEYSAAVHLAKRINDARDPLTLRQCIAIIAPNGVVREELRGLLGWLAAVGGEEIQTTAIELDPYTVLANGDPSQLLKSSKMLLLNKLLELSEEDPYFRGGDAWRSLNAVGVLTEDMADRIRAILVDQLAGWQLKGLILILLERSPAAQYLTTDLLALMLSSDQKTGLRHLAADCLLSSASRDHRADVTQLLGVGDLDSLEICAKYYQVLGASQLGKEHLKSLLLKCAELYPLPDEDMEDRMVGARIFIKRLVRTIDAPDVVWLLDELAGNLQCSCKADYRWQCHCRNGISKIVGYLLDQYFDQCEEAYDASQIYRWVKNLNFHNAIGEDRSSAVKMLKSEHSLRQDILKVIFDDRVEARVKEPLLTPFFLTPYIHQGLNLQWEDRLPLARHAFAVGNVRLWEALYHVGVTPDSSLFSLISELRRLMRNQAKFSSRLMEAWTRAELQAKQWRRNQRAGTQTSRRYRKMKERKHAAARKQVSRDRNVIQQGKHLRFLERIVFDFQHSPEKLEEVYGDLGLFRLAFRNCLPSLQPHLPSLEELARMRGGHTVARSEMILLAACIEIFRHHGNLDSVNQDALEIFMVNTDTHVDGVDEDEWAHIKDEVNRRLFQSDADKVFFLRRFLETQLKDSRLESTPAKMIWLRDNPIFSSVAGALALEWLGKFHKIGSSTLDVLFDTALAAGFFDELVGLVLLNTHDFFSTWPDSQEEDYGNSWIRFWLVRHVYFVKCPHRNVTHWLQSDPNILFNFEEISSPLFGDKPTNWPRLSAEKVYLILDAYVESWPPVYLPSSWGTDSPREETAFRFLRDLVWTIGKDQPENSIPILHKMLADPRFNPFWDALKTMNKIAQRSLALKNFEPPAPAEIVSLFQQNEVVTVEGLRALLLSELEILQGEVYGGEFNIVDIFYEGGSHVDENTASERIADRLRQRFRHLSMPIVIEHQLKAKKRCDITVTKVFRDQQKLLAIEVKGQWHGELLTAASEQLEERYAIHPNAEMQGVYLVLWFGKQIEVAGKRRHGLKSADELKKKIETELDKSLKGRVDVFVLDLSKP